MNLRVRGPRGQTVVRDLEEDASVSLVLTKISEATGISVDRLELSKGGGYPPQAVAVAIPKDPDRCLAKESLGISHNDMLIVNEMKVASGKAQEEDRGDAPNPVLGYQSANGRTTTDEDEMLARAIAASLGEEIPGESQHQTVPGLIEKGKPAFELLGSTGKAVVRRIVPDDNSCLFSAIAYCVGRGRMGASEMRSLVAQAVVADPIQWNEAILEKEPSEYAAWILDTSKWGGAIELLILSQQLAIEISAFDVQTQRIDTYGEGSGYSKRILVVYDGLHYDALALAAYEGAPEAKDQTMFSLDDPLLDDVLVGASSLVCRYHDLRQFTDTSKFTLRCNVCQLGLTGEKEAVQHAQASGHQSFSEY